MINIRVYGLDLDENTRCKHWNSSLDIIAIKTACCNKYYACASCHEEQENHSLKPILKKDWHKPNVLCGVCKTELTVIQYIQSDYTCIKCGSGFNPNCCKHHYIYFEM